MNDVLTKDVRAEVIAQGFTPAIADLVSVDQTAGLDVNAPPRGLIEMAYEGTRNGRPRRVVVSQISTPTIDDVTRIVRDRQSLGWMVLSALPSLPAHLRAEPMPEWLAGMNNVVGRDLARATQLSKSAMMNER